jgi:hypothetical protein
LLKLLLKHPQTGVIKSESSCQRMDRSYDT